MAYLSRLLSAVDAVIAPASTLLLESLMLGKPTMAIALRSTTKRHLWMLSLLLRSVAALNEVSVLPEPVVCQM